MDGILVIDKPENMTSFDVVNYVKRKTRMKVGHSGTLDPMATGVLVLATNKATKTLSYLGIDDKVYHTKLKLGLKTHTGDIWGDVIETSSIPNLNEENIVTILQSFVKPMNQRVPKVSAKRINGKRSYQYVLDEQPVEQLYTNIEIYSIDFISFDGETIEFIAKVSNGTYIRTLCEDVAEALGTIGTMSYLRRTHVGKFSLQDAIKLEDIDMFVPLISVKDAIQIPTVKMPNNSLEVRDGKRLSIETDHDKVFVDAGAYFAIYERESDTQFKSVRGLW